MKQNNQNKPQLIIIHCSATPEGRNLTAADIDRYHRSRGFAKIGYHYIIRLDGTIEKGRKETEVGAHCYGKNRCSIGICYIGGVKSDGTPADTRTPAQKESLKLLISDLRRRYPTAAVHGHRDFAAKACPSFDATAEYRGLSVAAIGLFAFSTISCKTNKTVSSTRSDRIGVLTEIKSEDILHRLINDSLELHILAPRVEIVNPDSSRKIVTAEQIRLTRRQTTREAQHTQTTASDSLCVSTQTTSDIKASSRPATGISLLWPSVILASAIITTFIIKKVITKWKRTLS